MRAAIIGLGSHFGLGRHHSTVYDQRPEVGHLVLCDTNRDAAEACAAQVGTPSTIYTRVEEMFEREQLDVVSILTPDHLHRAHAELAFAAGANVLLTKPIAPSLPDARAIIVAAARANRRLMIAQERRFQADNLRAKHLIESGRLGEIALIALTELQQHVREKFAHAPWYASRESGRTMMTGSGVHQVDLMRYLAGREVATVMAQGNRVGDLAYWHQKTVAAIFRFADAPTIGNLIFSYEGMPGMTRGGTVVIGSRGMIGQGRFRDRETGEEEDLTEGLNLALNSHQACAHSFLDTLCQNMPIAVTGEDAFASVAAAAAVDKACETGEVVVPETLAP